MKIYHITDLHNELWRASQLLEIMRPNSLLAISGDLIDWTGQNLPEEIRSIQSFLVELAEKAARKGCHIAVCSGNHDAWAAPAETPYWLEIPNRPNLTGDFGSQIVSLGSEKLVVTGLPWRNYEEPENVQVVHPSEVKTFGKDKRAHERCLETLELGCELAGKENLPWVWLHHNPPSFVPTASGWEASRQLLLWCQKYRPSAILSGHVHDPKETLCQIDDTISSNPGRFYVTTRYNTITTGENPQCETLSLDGIATTTNPEKPESPQIILTEGEDAEEWLLRIRNKNK